MSAFLSQARVKPWRRKAMQVGASLVLVLLCGAFFTAQAAVCTPPTVAVNPAAPQTQWLRGYRHEFKSPLRLAINPAGNLFIADPNKGEVAVRAADGRMLHVQRGLGQPGAIAVDAGGRIFVGDLLDGAISVFDQDWNLLQRFALGEVSQIVDIALDSARSRVYVSDSEGHQVRVYSDLGAPLFVVGGPGEADGQFRYPSGVFYDATSDELLVSDQFGYRVQVFAGNGQFKYCIGGSSARPGSFFQGGRLLASPQGLWADTQGRVYVADSFEGKVKVLDRRGMLLKEIGRFGEGAGELRIPSDVVMDSAGRLFIASTNNSRIEIFGIDGYSDPELYTPALLGISPSLVLPGTAGLLSAVIRTPGVRLSDVALDSLSLNGVLATSATLADRDRDGEDEIHTEFDLAALLATLPASGPGQLVLDGLAGSLGLHGVAGIEIVSMDADADGVLDTDDQCQATAANELVDSVGCSISQLCPCDGFKGHGAYVKCVARVSKRFMNESLLERSSRKQLVRQAARSDCGKGRQRHRRHRGHDDDEHERHDATEHDNENEHDARGEDQEDFEEGDDDRRRGRSRR